MKRIASERVYTATFANRLEDMAAYLDAMDEFAHSWGADYRKCYTLRLAVEEVCGIVRDGETTETGKSVLTQLTLIAKEDGSFQLHLRNNGAQLDLEELNKDFGFAITEEPKKLGIVVLRVAKNRARQFLYRNYHGFNTFVVTA